MWRPSGRGCTVMPCAPASMQMRAQRVTLGMPIVRVLRSSATLLRLTLSRVMEGPLERVSKLLQLDQQLARVERALIEVLPDQPAHELLALGRGERIAEIAARHVEQRLAAQ